MKTTSRLIIPRGLATLAFAVTLITASIPAQCQPGIGDNPSATEETGEWQKRVHDRMRVHLDELAKRLQLTDSQQAAWSDYVKTVESMAGSRPTPPSKDAEAATVMRFRADLAIAHAKKLSQVADATARLQQALNPEQRDTLNQMVRAHERRGDYHGERHGPGAHEQ